MTDLELLSPQPLESMAVEILTGSCFSRPGNRVRCVVLLCVIFTLGGVVYLGYFCPEKVCALTNARRMQTNSASFITNENPKSLKSFNAKNGNGRKYEDRDWVYDPHSPQNHFQDQEQDQEVEYEREVLNLFQSPVSAKMSVPYELLENRPKLRSHQTDIENQLVTFEQMHNSSENRFDLETNDVMVFLHIQKTGGTTFGRHLVHDLDLDKPCECRKKGKGQKKRCKCVRPNSDNSYWLFSRFSTGWQCGLHADWTELTSCVESVLDKEEGVHVKRRFFYITLLREPVIRFLSEFLHVQRGATWKTARHRCGGREALAEELPACYKGDNWEDVSLEEFLACPSNLAINRQTRMLADLTLVGCYNASALPLEKREAMMLASAKENLRRLAYFGLCENQQMAQYMFEETFQMSFLTNFQQFNETHVTSVFKDVTKEQLEDVRRLNHLDLQLYEYAKSLLEDRFDRVKKIDPSFAEHYQVISRPATRFQAPVAEESDSNR